MSTGFHLVYRWVRSLTRTQPQNAEARLLLALLRQWHGLERQRQCFPGATPANLQPAVEENILTLVRRLQQAEGRAA